MADAVPGAELRPLTHEQADRILAAVFDTPPTREPLHERDCPACDVAEDIAGCLAAVWDPHENWHEATVDNGLPGDTLLVQVSRVAAHVLHRRMPGHTGVAR